MTEASAPATPTQLLAYLGEMGIETTTVTHPAVFTVDEAKQLRGELPGGHCKSLFLRNKKGRMWLVVTLEDRQIDLKALGEQLGAGRLSFGSHDRLGAECRQARLDITTWDASSVGVACLPLEKNARRLAV